MIKHLQEKNLTTPRCANLIGTDAVSVSMLAHVCGPKLNEKINNKHLLTWPSRIML